MSVSVAGNTIRRVMAETSCHIHFPDSNRSNPNEKSNQVSIAGKSRTERDFLFLVLAGRQGRVRTRPLLLLCHTSCF